MGLRVKVGRFVRDRYAYLAGQDRDRAADLDSMFANREVAAVLALRGGWGAARILPLVDYAGLGGAFVRRMVCLVHSG